MKALPENYSLRNSAGFALRCILYFYGIIPAFSSSLKKSLVRK
jgi:hypothetical protein